MINETSASPDATTDSNTEDKRSSTRLDQSTELQDSKFAGNVTSFSSSLPGNNELISLNSNISDLLPLCKVNLTCKADLSTGWKDNSSINVSTNSTENKDWGIPGQQVSVKPNDRFQFVIHMKLNKWSMQARVDFEGFNETSKRWDRIDQCPSASLNGPLEWKEFSCGIAIDKNITKLRSVLNAGFSADPHKEASSWFDSIYLIKFKQFLADPNLAVQVVYKGLNGPVSMDFLGPNDFLVTERNGTVQRIVNGVGLTKPVIELNVTRDGLLGIATNKQFTGNNESGVNNPTYVFLYLGTYRNEHNNNSPVEGIAANRLYRYELVNNSLINPKLLLDVPAGYNHNGGPILLSADKQSLFVSVGDVENQTYQVLASKALNNNTGPEPDGTGGILRLTQDGEPLHDSVFDAKYPLNLYYAYGIRQNFGMDFDPLTGKLWDAENGANWGDEVNMVEPGFNSGWDKVQGIWKDHVRDGSLNDSDILHNPTDLVDFDGKGKYSEPEFTWKYTVGPTALKFVSNDKLGKKYENNMFIADANNGRIYNFKLNESRTGFILDGPLSDKIADTDNELDKLIFAGDFGIITDLKIGPDGYLYFVVYNEGIIYKIVPRI